MREGLLVAYVCVAAAACFSPSPPAGVPCGPDFTCPGEQVCDIISNECGAATEALLWRDDSADDFAAGGAYLDEVTVEKQGFVGPAAFSGAARLAGYDGLLVPNASVMFEDIVANTATGVGLEHDLRIEFGGENPPGLGAASGDDITVTVEGEIELDTAGDWRFRLTANDRGFFDLETSPGSGTFTRVVFDDDTGTNGDFVAPVAGWYRYRGAFQDANELLDYRVEADSPNVQGNGFNDVSIDRLRARAGDLEGLIVDGFDQAFMMLHTLSRLSSDSLANLSLPQDPLGFPIGISGFSLRWNGQFLIDLPGDYTFALQTADGHRLWIDGVLVADKYSTSSEESTTAPITLEAGWHDLVLDVTKQGGSTPGSVDVTIASGPQFVGAWFPADHLRPISGRRARFVTDANTGNLAIPDGPATPPAPVTRTLTVDLPASFSPIDVRAAVELDHTLPSSVELLCDPPGGSEFTVAAFGAMSDADTNHFFHLPRSVANGAPFWQFTATDNLTDTNVGVISTVMVTMTYDGGTAPFPTAYRYVSAVRDLGDVVAFERIAWLLRQAPDPSAVRVGLRTCDAADGCASEPFVDVVNGGVPDVPVRRFAQYQVDFTSDGDLPTALDAIELRYFVRDAQ